MRPIAISSCLALAALSLYAAEPQAAHPQTVLSSPQQAAAVDSPLVRAAKATNRLGKRPPQVITNDTLVRQGGHFTTTTAQPQPAAPPNQNSTAPSFDQMVANAQRSRVEANSAAQRAKKADEAKRIASDRAAARAEGDTPELFYGDPPSVPSKPQPMKPVTPETMGREQKPPL